MKDLQKKYDDFDTIVKYSVTLLNQSVGDFGYIKAILDYDEQTFKDSIAFITVVDIMNSFVDYETYDLSSTILNIYNQYSNIDEYLKNENYTDVLYEALKKSISLLNYKDKEILNLKYNDDDDELNQYLFLDFANYTEKEFLDFKTKFYNFLTKSSKDKEPVKELVKEPVEEQLKYESLRPNKSDRFIVIDNSDLIGLL